MDEPAYHRIDAAALAAFVARSLRAAGLPEDAATEVAAAMVEADLTGADAHGVFRLPQYVDRLEAGGINPRPSIAATRTAAGTATIDGDNGFGHLVVGRAVSLAVEMAAEAGIGWVSIRRSNHAGSAGIYPARIAAAGMIGLYSAVASANHMAPWGGAEMLLGTNPLAIALPGGGAGQPSILLDMATTAVSYGTIKKHALAGRPLEEGWMVHRQTGEPILDPAKAGDGVLLPMGGYKGSGLALMLGLLAGPLGGAAFGRDVVDFNADPASETNTGHFVMALDPQRLAGGAPFAEAAGRHLGDLRASAPLPGRGPVRLPGDGRAERRAERGRDGVPLPPALRARLDALAARLAVAPL